MQTTKKKLLAGGIALALALALAAPVLAEPLNNDDYASPDLGDDDFSAFGYSRGYNGDNGYNSHDDDYQGDSGADIGAVIALGLLSALAGAMTNDGYGNTGYNNGFGWNNGYGDNGYGWNNNGYSWNNNHGSNYGSGYGWGNNYGSNHGHNNYSARAALEACERKAEQVNWNRGGHGFEWTQVYDIDRLNNGAYRVQARGVSKYNGPDYYVDVTCRVNDGQVTRFRARPA